MTHIKHAQWIQWIAGLLAILFGTAAFLGILTILMTFGMELYKKPLDKVLNEHYKDLQEYYSARIVNREIKDKTPLVIPNLEYGIIPQTDEEKPDFEHRGEYIYDTFSATVPETSSYKLSYGNKLIDDLRPASQVTLMSSLSRPLAYITHELGGTDYYMPIKQIVYNKTNGVFYFETDEHSIPIPSIRVYSVNAEKKNGEESYKQTYKTFTLADYDLFRYEADTSDTVYQFYMSEDEEYNPLNTANYKNWQAFYVNKYKFYVNAINTVTSGDLLPLAVVSHYDENSYLYTTSEYNIDVDGLHREEYPMISYYAQTSPEQTYWLVSNVKPTIDTSANDLFAGQTLFLSALYRFRYFSLFGTPLLLVAAFACLYLLCISLKAQRDAETLRISLWYRIPLLLPMALLVTLFTVGSLIISEILDAMFDGVLGGRLSLVGITFLGAMCMACAVLLVENFARRCYAKVLLKYSITGFLVNKFQNIWRLFREQTSLMVKGSIAFLCFSLMELFCFIVIYDTAEFGVAFIFWLIFRILIAVLFLICLLQMKQLQQGSQALAEGKLQNKIDTSKMFWEFRKHGEYLNQINEGMAIALEEQMRSERFKTELITNVSHDIKTPLTSIINYVDLLQKENVSEEDRTEYLTILNRQSARLKKLIEDLMEASKASTGNLPVQMETCDMDILLTQTIGEYEEKLLNNGLELIVQKLPNPVYVNVDSRHLWRIFDNLMNNICKYAQPGTRVYINLKTDGEKVLIIFLNISQGALNISGDELMERFVRGDSSRNTEGSGLGLSIAKSLAELMNGTLKLQIEGDLFKVTLTFVCVATNDL